MREGQGWLARNERLVLAAIGGLEYVIGYFGVNHFSIGREAATLQTALDAAWPLVPAWAFIYSTAIPMCFTPAFFVSEVRQLRTALAGFTIAMAISVAVFLAYPVVMIRPPLPADAFGSWVLALTWQLDAPYNCFPSLHVGLDIYAALCCHRANRTAGRAVGVMAFLISLATLFVKQHYLADVLAGVALAVGSFRLAERPAVLAAIGGERIGA